MSISVFISIPCLAASIETNDFNHRNQCVRIYFDRSKNPEKYSLGRSYAMMAQNLLGHFPKWQQIVSPIELYQQGDIETCDATIYLGSYFENAIPQSFYDDFAKTKKRVLWAGYSIWKYPPDTLQDLFGFEYLGLSSLNLIQVDAKGLPSFYRDVIYKGETFTKFGEYVKIDPDRWDSETEFRASFEQILVKPVGAEAEVLAYAKHSATGEKVPYLIKKQNRFYLADIPFSYIHESDRMLVFADLLFDLLSEKPRHQERYAVIRIEDVHPLTEMSFLGETLQVFREEKAPINLSLIPIYYDPLYRDDRRPDEEMVPMDRRPDFMNLVKKLKKEKATFILHGVTHQYGNVENPHDAVSGDDFEFWNAVSDRPLANDSAPWVLDRLEDAWYTLRNAGVSSRIWLTPHYQASALDYYIFARVFPWNVGRAIYFNYQVEGMPPAPVPEKDLWFHILNPANGQNRLDAFRDIRIQTETAKWDGQLFPYEIYGDIYGQRLIPENLGNSQPYISSHVVRTRSVKQIIADAKRNLVIRDAWASLFYHPFLANTVEEGGRGHFPGDTSELRYLIRELKKLGYHFVNLDEWTQKNTLPIRPEPIVKDTLKLIQ